LQDQNLQLEKARADLTLDLKRSTAAKEAAENVAKAAQVQLQGVLAELDNAKHSTEAASTTSQFVCKVRMCWHIYAIVRMGMVRMCAYSTYAAASALRWHTG
jgi:threonine/homoserine/homoserine lactone efflux protein